MRLRDLTTGECLLLDRRRRNESQREAAARMGVSRYRYRKWEAEEESGAARPALQRLLEHERYFLRRQRSDPAVSLAELAERIGCSRWWACQMERGKAPLELLEGFWGAKTA